MNPPLWAVLIALFTLAVQPVWADPPDPSTPVPAEPSNMTMAQLQGLSCLGAGTLGGLVAYAYTDMLVLTGTIVVNPLLIVLPAVATGFAVGCSVGANVAPGLFWLHRSLR